MWLTRSPLSGQFGEQRVAVSVVVRPGIDDGHVSAPDYVGVGSHEGHGAGIVGHETAQVGRDFARLAIFKVELQLESKVGLHLCYTARACISHGRERSRRKYLTPPLV